MKFGIRQCANVVFKTKQRVRINSKIFNPGQVVLYIDSATVSELSTESSSVYASGGRGNSRLVAWEGDKTLTFTITDALMSTTAFNLLLGDTTTNKYSKYNHKYFHAVEKVKLEVFQQDNEIKGRLDLRNKLKKFGDIIGLDNLSVITDGSFPFYVIRYIDDDITDYVFEYDDVEYDEGIITLLNLDADQNEDVLVDFYIFKASGIVSIEITPQNFAGFYYVEADTLFRNVINGTDVPVSLTFPNVKLQSNFTISLSSTGDPNTFDFTIDAFPGYTYFDRSRKVLCVMQLVEDTHKSEYQGKTVMEKNDIHQYEDIFNKGFTIDNMLTSKNHVDYTLKPELEGDTLLFKNESINISQMENDPNQRYSTLRDLKTMKDYLDDNFLVLDNDTVYVQKKSQANIFSDQSDVNNPVNRNLRHSDLKKVQAYIDSFNTKIDDEEGGLLVKGKED